MGLGWHPSGQRLDARLASLVMAQRMSEKQRPSNEALHPVGDAMVHTEPWLYSMSNV